MPQYCIQMTVNTTLILLCDIKYDVICDWMEEKGKSLPQSLPDRRYSSLPISSRGPGGPAHRFEDKKLPPLRADLGLGPRGGYPVDLGVNFVAQILPNIFRHFEKHFHHFGIKLLSGPLVDLDFGSVQRLLRPVNPVGGDRIQRVGDGEDASPEGNLFSLQAARITTAVEPLLVRVHDLGGLCQKWNFLHDLITVVGVLLHDRHFVGLEFSRLLQ